MSDTLVKVENVSKKFCRDLKRSLWYGVQDLTAELLGRAGRGNEHLKQDEFWALDNINFELRRGESIGLIGRNGAGKTTLLRVLNGLIKPNVGRIEMRGRVGALIALGAGFNPILTGRENIYVNGAVLGLKKQEIDAKIEEIIEFSGINEFIDAPVQSYSSGMQVRLGFAVATSLHPDILLLDEVLAVGDIAFQAKCFNTLSQYRDKGTAFILVSHNMHHINRYADRVLYLKRGKVVRLGPPEEVIAMYLDDMTGTPEFRDDEVTDSAVTYGSGKLVINSVDFVDALGNVVEKIKADQSVCLRIAYTCDKSNIMNPLVDILIRDREGIFFQGTNLLYGQDLGELPKNGIIEVRFDSIPANNQHLLFYVTVMNRQTKEIYDWRRNIPLKVIGIAGSHGRVQLMCQWNISDSIGL